MNNRCVCLALTFIFACGFMTCLVAQDKKKSDDELTLENLFPKKSMFGPSARSMAFSSDGRFAAYLYRPYPKRRHGNDLWLYDFKTGKLTQLTDVNTMSKFQRSARKVKQDRLDKHQKAEKKKAKEKAAKDGKNKTGDQADSKTSQEKSKQKSSGKRKRLKRNCRKN